MGLSTYTKKPAEVRMGKGKGKIDSYVSPVPLVKYYSKSGMFLLKQLGML